MDPAAKNLSCWMGKRIINKAGEIVQTRNFGPMTEDKFRRVLQVIQQENPDLVFDEPIELTGN